MYNFDEVVKADPEVADVMSQEMKRQETNIELIASENFVSKAVMAAMGSPLTNKYAEGYPGKRYYGGCHKVDIVENIAKDRLKELFGAEHANVQPHSGAQANTAVYFSVLNPGDTILGMSLAHGGHLTHGSPVNISGKYFNIIPYGVHESTCLINYDALRDLALKHRPKMIVAGASAYPRTIDFECIGSIAKEAGAYLMVDMAHIAGLVAAGCHPSPVGPSDFVTSTSHKTLRGPRGGFIVCPSKYAKEIDKAIFPGTQGGPLMHVIAAKAVSFKEALQDPFKTYSRQIIKNADALGKSLIEHGFNLVTGGTDTHLVLVDLRNMDLTGKEAENRLDNANITCNKNTIPFDPKSPFITSGIRLGTPAITTRGFVEEDMHHIAHAIALVLKKGDVAIDEARAIVNGLTEKYPMSNLQ